VPAGGDQQPAGAPHPQHSAEVLGLLGAVQEQERPFAGQQALGRVGGGVAGTLVKAADDVLQGQGGVGTAVEAVKEDAVGKGLGRPVAGGEGPQRFGGEGGLADAPRAAEGGQAAGLQGGEELGEVLGAAGEVLGAGRALEGDGGRGWWRCGVVVLAADVDVPLNVVHVSYHRPAVTHSADPLLDPDFRLLRQLAFFARFGLFDFPRRSIFGLGSCGRSCRGFLPQTSPELLKEGVNLLLSVYSNVFPCCLQYGLKRVSPIWELPIIP
jgi:hypothetical protein